MTGNQGKFSISMKVRDYECDMQGIVNNSVYLNYLEHARHEFLETVGLNFKTLLEKGIYLVAVQADQLYKRPLLSGQEFNVTCQMYPESKFKIRFKHEIYNERDELVLEGNMVVAAIDKDRKPVLISSFYQVVGA
ncbi:MAG: acyl-CoA thioesterase [Gammaproteobacteria bacterium]